jgi:hypothetical protein
MILEIRYFGMISFEKVEFQGPLLPGLDQDLWPDENFDCLPRSGFPKLSKSCPGYCWVRHLFRLSEPGFLKIFLRSKMLRVSNSRKGHL